MAAAWLRLISARAASIGLQTNKQSASIERQPMAADAHQSADQAYLQAICPVE
jgi:hypothetical protein